MPIFNNPRIITDGLVFAVDAANRKSYSGNGTIWSDIVNSNSGTLTNGPTYSSSNNGYIIFDGTNDFASFSSSDSLNPETGSLSIVCVVNTNPVGTEYWVSKRSSSTNGYYVGFNSTLGVRATFANTLGTRVDTGYISYTPNTWAMFTSVLDVTNNTQKIIKNNNQETSSVTPAGGTYSNVSNLFIGGISSFYTVGSIALVLIYKKALSSSEISQNFKTIKGRYNL